MTIKIIVGDALDVLQALPERSVQTCVTSPPYWGLRDYGISGQLGLEKTPEEYVAKLVAIFQGVYRVLRDDGTLWLNLGDSYYGDSPPRKSSAGAFSKEWNPADSAGNGGLRRSAARCGDLKPKDLIGIPWMVAFALRADGWWLRNEIIWHKPNVMPESVRDRLTRAHEQLFLLTKQSHYYYDQDAIREPQTGNAHSRGSGSVRKEAEPGQGIRSNASYNRAMAAYVDVPGGRNRRTVWTIQTESFRGAHFATYPPALIEPCILAGTSERGACPTCGAPWKRITEREPVPGDIGDYGGKYLETDKQSAPSRMAANRAARRAAGGDHDNPFPTPVTVDWQPSCNCPPANPQPCVVLDPFGGAGTTGLVADRLGRDAILIELNPQYAELGRQRLVDDIGMLARVEIQDR